MYYAKVACLVIVHSFIYFCYFSLALLAIDSALLIITNLKVQKQRNLENGKTIVAVCKYYQPN